MLAYANLWGRVRSLDIQAIQATRLAHLHFEIRIGGTNINPYDIVQ